MPRNSEIFQKLPEAYYEKPPPADDVERDLVDETVVAKWRQRRVRRNKPKRLSRNTGNENSIAAEEERRKVAPQPRIYLPERACCYIVKVAMSYAQPF